MNIRIIVDSTADLLPEIQPLVHVVPLTVRFGDEEYIDGVTIDHKTFYEKLIESDVIPTTSQASPAAFAIEYEKAAAAGDSAVVIAAASGLSGTYQSACIAAADFAGIQNAKYRIMVCAKRIGCITAEGHATILHSAFCILHFGLITYLLQTG